MEASTKLFVFLAFFVGGVYASKFWYWSLAKRWGQGDRKPCTEEGCSLIMDKWIHFDTYRQMIKGMFWLRQPEMWWLCDESHFDGDLAYWERRADRG